jgi:hypothetical protein
MVSQQHPVPFGTPITYSSAIHHHLLVSHIKLHARLRHLIDIGQI